MSKFNRQALFELVSYATLGSIILYLLLTKNYLLLLSPKAKPFLYFTCIILALWSYLAIKNLTFAHYKNNYFQCLPITLLAIVLTLPIFSSHSLSVYSMQTELEKKTIQPASQAPPTYINHQDYLRAQNMQKNSTLPNAFNNKKIKSPNDTGIDDLNQTITLTSDNFYNTILKLHNHLDDYQGYEIIMTGFISYDDDILGPNDFKLSRILMICCVADMAPFGIVCHYDGNRIEQNQWYTVKGIIGKRNFHGLQQPYVDIQLIQKDKPIPGYVYPN